MSGSPYRPKTVVAAGKTVRQTTAFRIVGAANPLVDSLERLTSKLDSGVTLLQGNIS